MQRPRSLTGSIVLGLALLIPSAVLPGGADAIVAGAGFTTFDATQGGCQDSPNGINCNNYDAKHDVTRAADPAAGLSDGWYYFTVLVPGHQRAACIAGADGNLSETTAGATPGDRGSGDTVADRTFHVSGKVIDAYAGGHAWGTSPNGRDILGLMPYDDTSNAGGVYILAICPAVNPTPASCKYDAFRIEPGTTVTPFSVVSGSVYFDANVNGIRDAGEVGIGGWTVPYTDEVSGVETTDGDGNFSVTLIADTYLFWQSKPAGPWLQTGNRANQAASSGGSWTSLSNFEYTVVTGDGGTTTGLNFGDVCIGAGGGHTLGFWSNKNGQTQLGDGGSVAPELALLSGLNLRTATGRTSTRRATPGSGAGSSTPRRRTWPTCSRPSSQPRS